MGTDSGYEVLIVHSALATAVITGTSSAAVWEAAAAIEGPRLSSALEQLIDQPP